MKWLICALIQVTNKIYKQLQKTIASNQLQHHRPAEYKENLVLHSSTYTSCCDNLEFKTTSPPLDSHASMYKASGSDYISVSGMLAHVYTHHLLWTDREGTRWKGGGWTGYGDYLLVAKVGQLASR